MDDLAEAEYQRLELEALVGPPAYPVLDTPGQFSSKA